MQEKTRDLPGARLEFARVLHLSLRWSAADFAQCKELNMPGGAYSHNQLELLIHRLQSAHGTLRDPPEGVCRTRSLGQG